MVRQEWERSPLQRLITIDGPAGCGKSTAAHGLARSVDGLALNTGLIYRAVTWLALKHQVDLRDDGAVSRLLDSTPITLVEDSGELRVQVGREFPGEELREAHVTTEIHWVADSPELRARLLPLQRSWSSTRIVVAEGRDLGTVVFPDAPLKIFLTASIEERAQRRHSEQQRKGRQVSFEQVLSEVEQRDRFDREREVAPLRAAEDAQVIDCSQLDAAATLQCVRDLVPRVARTTVLAV